MPNSCLYLFNSLNVRANKYDNFLLYRYDVNFYKFNIPYILYVKRKIAVNT